MQPDFVVRNVADNTAGMIRYAATQVSRPESATGSGPVARIRFTALKPGQFTMPFISYELSDRNGGMILSTPQSCTVTFEPPTTVGCDPAFVIGSTGHALTVNLDILDAEPGLWC